MALFLYPEITKSYVRIERLMSQQTFAICCIQACMFWKKRGEQVSVYCLGMDLVLAIGDSHRELLPFKGFVLEVHIDEFD
jgi:hypothetical protein